MRRRGLESGEGFAQQGSRQFVELAKTRDSSMGRRNTFVLSRTVGGFCRYRGS